MTPTQVSILVLLGAFLGLNATYTGQDDYESSKSTYKAVSVIESESVNNKESHSRAYDASALPYNSGGVRASDLSANQNEFQNGFSSVYNGASQTQGVQSEFATEPRITNSHPQLTGNMGNSCLDSTGCQHLANSGFPAANIGSSPGDRTPPGFGYPQQFPGNSYDSTAGGNRNAMPAYFGPNAGANAGYQPAPNHVHHHHYYHHQPPSYGGYPHHGNYQPHHHGYRTLDHTLKENTEYSENGHYVGPYQGHNNDYGSRRGSGGYNGAFNRPIML